MRTLYIPCFCGVCSGKQMGVSVHEAKRWVHKKGRGHDRLKGWRESLQDIFSGSDSKWQVCVRVYVSVVVCECGRSRICMDVNLRMYMHTSIHACIHSFVSLHMSIYIITMQCILCVQQLHFTCISKYKSTYINRSIQMKYLSIYVHMQLVVVLIPRQDPEIYSFVKHRTVIDEGVISQCFSTDSFKKPQMLAAMCVCIIRDVQTSVAASIIHACVHVYVKSLDSICASMCMCVYACSM